jgi:hypothetical protein
MFNINVEKTRSVKQDKGVVRSQPMERYFFPLRIAITVLIITMLLPGCGMLGGS